MARTREQKEQIVVDLVRKLTKAKSVIFANFFGLDVKSVEILRKLCRKGKVDYQVVKKTLLARAYDAAGIKNMPTLEGEIALAFSYDDETGAAKILDTFAQERETLKIIGGILDNKFLREAEALNLARLPSYDELAAKLVASINAPRVGMVNVLAGSIRNLICVLSAIKQPKP